MAQIKKISNWKHGLGQLLVYSYLNPNHKRLLILFGKPISNKNYEFLVEACSFYSVSVFFVNSGVNDNAKIQQIHM